MSKSETVMRCCPVRIKNYDPELESFYNDMQEDYKKYCELFLNCMEIGYTKFDENNNLIVIEPEEQIKKRNQYLKNNSEIIKAASTFCSLYFAGQTSSSSNYSCFYKDFEPSSAARYNKRLMDHPEEFEKISETNTGLKKLTVAEWQKHAKKIKNLNESEKKEYWNKYIGEKVVNDDRSTGVFLRKKLNIKCNRPEDKDYCTQLSEMIYRTLRSIKEKYDFHVAEWNKNKTKVDAFINDELFIHFQNILKKSIKDKMEISPYMLGLAVKGIFKKPKKNKFCQDKIDYLIKKMDVEKYDFTKCMNMVENLEFYENFKSKKKYPMFPKLNDYKIPFGLTSIGKFSFTKNENIFEGKIANYNFSCYQSCYFDNLEINKNENSYQIKFNHIVKNNKNKYKTPSSPTIEGVVKEIGLLRKNGYFELTIPFHLAINQDNQQLQNFFRTASPTKEQFKSLKSDFIAVGVDLNLQDPLVITKGVVSKIQKYPLQVRDFGFSKILKTQVLIESTDLSDEIKNFCKDIRLLKVCIKEIKKYKNKAEDVPFDTCLYLGEASTNNYSLLRCKFQDKIKTIKSKLKYYWNRNRAIGNNDIAAMLRLLQAEDEYRSLISSYERFHLKAGESLLAVRKFNYKRINLKEDFLKKLANKLTKYCIENDVSLIFIEDLDSEQNSKNSRQDNSLIRLFSAKGITDAIKNSAEKYGIYCVEIDKKGTSKTDPVTGKLGYRNECNKSDLFVIRQNKKLCLNADMSASQNIFLKGIDRSIIPYSFYWPKSSKELGKRITVFLKSMFKTTKIRFYQNQNELIPSTKKLKTEEYFGTIYYSNNKFYSKDQQIEKQKQIEDKFMDKSVDLNKIEKIDVNLDTKKSYANFQP